MTRNNKLLLGFALIVIIPVSVVWYTAWPILRPWPLPPALSGYESAPQSRELTADEVQQFNHWVQTHKTGWGVSGEKTPGPAQRVVTLRTAQGLPVIVSLWHFRHGDDVVGIQTAPQGAYRMRSCIAGEVAALLPASQSHPTP
ncbi:MULTISPECIES: hypothetical protein [unclassified Saccharibacter]|uniref:hypothetical protein n=1 Tax=unclassified Saccharibacter TaxID=2648722 RepID=UPI00132A3DC4|nr:MULTISPECIES: hypothetical protein [unclassified Saccharibacter]MXV36234.1 hypothetical protein [Saccharibacter sp. EH611]MXV57094.1 hypothetical protein [Saccharibacter sp. EH70]MXV66546.1 hypothetical protein [Saccharibacter sp. EH60]